MTKSSSGHQARQDRRDQIAADHHNLRVTIDQLLNASNLPLIIGHLRRLRSELVEHFKLEEGGDGLAKAIGETAPNALNKLGRLFDEHGEFLGTIGRLIDETNACLNGPVADIENGIRRLCAQLEAHEATETELISEAVFTDLGSGE